MLETLYVITICLASYSHRCIQNINVMSVIAFFVIGFKKWSTGGKHAQYSKSIWEATVWIIEY